MATARVQVQDAFDDFPLPQRASLATAIADSVAEAIATGHLEPGERVIETALAERFGVSRVPIREALKVLHAQGILSGGGHRGYRVAAFDLKTIDKVFEVRLALEAFLLRDAVERWRSGEANIVELDTAIKHMDAAARADDRRASLRADVEFHRTICRASGNLISSTLWEAIARHVLIIFSLEAYRDSNLFAIADQHRAFRDFIASTLTMRKALTVEDCRLALEDHILLVARAKRLKKSGSKA